MNYTTSVFKRAARIKSTKQVDQDGNRKTVKVQAAWVYRVRYTDTSGKLRVQERGFSTKQAAKDALDLAVALLKATEGNSRTGERMTFSQLAEICLKEIYHPARYEEDSGKKRSGVKSVKTFRSAIKRLRMYFGDQRIQAINPQNLVGYREHRKTQTFDSEGNPLVVKIATINRELSVLRRMLEYASDQSWIAQNPFKKAKRVINVSLEQRRKRVLLPDEELRLLAACTGKLSKTYVRKRMGKEEVVKMEIDLDHHPLRVAILLGLDCGLRRNEIVSLEWSDIHFGAGYITIREVTAKDEETRYVPLTTRLEHELMQLKSVSESERVFQIKDWKKSFSTVRELAGLPDFWFKDLRRTFSHRLSHVMPLETVAQVMGHSDVQTTHEHYQGKELGPVLTVKKYLDEQYALASDAVN